MSFCSCLQSTSLSTIFGLSVMFNKPAELWSSSPSLSGGPQLCLFGFQMVGAAQWFVHSWDIQVACASAPKPTLLKPGTGMAPLLPLVTEG